MSPGLAADRADRLHTAMLARCWPPPREGAPRTVGAAQGGKNSEIEGSLKYIVGAPLRKAEVLDRRADLLLAEGHHAAAERLAHQAAAMRQAVAA